MRITPVQHSSHSSETRPPNAINAQNALNLTHSSKIFFINSIQFECGFFWPIGQWSLHWKSMLSFCFLQRPLCSHFLSLSLSLATSISDSCSFTDRADHAYGDWMSEAALVYSICVRGQDVHKQYTYRDQSNSFIFLLFDLMETKLMT